MTSLEENREKKRKEKLPDKPAKSAGISINPDNRVLLCGKTGSGKSTLAEFLLMPIERLIVIDGKDGLQSWTLEDYSKSKHFNKIKNNEALRVRIVDKADTLDVLKECYEVGNIMIYIDEITASIPPLSKPDDIYVDIWTRGRQRKIGAWGASQRPKQIPLFFFTEAEHIFMFRLSMEADRKRVAESAGSRVLVNPVDRFGFYYYNVNDDKLRYFKRLNI